MNQGDLIAFFIVILSMLVLLLVLAKLVLRNHQGSIDTRRQAIRISLFVGLYVLLLMTGFMSISTRVVRITVTIDRHYQDVAIDGEALNRTENFNYTAVIGSLFGIQTMFPPFPYNSSERIVFSPFSNMYGVSLSTGIMYRAIITHPNATVNMTQVMVDSDWTPSLESTSIASRENGSWHVPNTADNLLIPITWLVEANYSESGSMFVDARVLVGLNASLDVIFIARTENYGFFDMMP
nr:hypothetical protein [Candidatus Sigynarchaeota archaeon]